MGVFFILTLMNRVKCLDDSIDNTVVSFSKFKTFVGTSEGFITQAFLIASEKLHLDTLLAIETTKLHLPQPWFYHGPLIILPSCIAASFNRLSSANVNIMTTPKLGGTPMA